MLLQNYRSSGLTSRIISYGTHIQDLDLVPFSDKTTYYLKRFINMKLRTMIHTAVMYGAC